VQQGNQTQTRCRMGQLKKENEMNKEKVKDKQVEIRQLEMRLEELQMEHNVAIQSLRNEIHGAMKIRVAEINTRLEKIYSSSNCKISRYFQRQIKELRYEKFDLECSINGIC